MFEGLERLKAAAQEIDDFVDPSELRQVIDILELKVARALHRGRQRGDYQLFRLSPAGWAARTCRMSRSAASDRLHVGAEIEALPQVEAAVTRGEIGYQTASAVCHLKSDLGEKWQEIDQRDLLARAKNYSIEAFRMECRRIRYEVDPDGADRFAEEDFERRWLKINPMLDGMYAVDGVLDSEIGSTFRTVLDSLANQRGPEDKRNHGQRTADALGELMHRVMDEGRLPRRNGVRPHITVMTTIEGLKRELGAAASELQGGMPISHKTVQRLACDGTLHRVLKADSVVIDVGRATRAVSPSQWRALKARYHSCAWPDCDRPLNWTNPHHVEFWADGGPSDASNLLPLCWYHHRLVHEGGWQVIKVGEEIQWIPPDRLVSRWAA